MDSSNNRVLIVSGIVLCLLAVSVVLIYLEYERAADEEIANTEAFLQAASNKINSSLPMNIDAETRLDSSVGVDSQMRFNFTMLNYSAKQLDVDAFKQTVTQRMFDNVCGTDKMAVFLEKGISVTYAYSGNDGELFHEISIQPGECEAS